MIRCLCCEQEAQTPATVLTETEMHFALHVLLLKGYTAEDLATRPDCVESLDITTPGFVPWLRRTLAERGNER